MSTMPNTTETAAKAVQDEEILAQIVSSKGNENPAKFFAAGMLGIIALFMIFHWTRHIFKKYESKLSRVPAMRVPTAIARTARKLFIRKIPGFTSAGHGIIVLCWLATSITISFVNIDWSDLLNWGRRLGWVAIANLALVVFLSLKNTPLAFLTTYSYERLNILHQIAGYGTIFFSVLHSIIQFGPFASIQEFNFLWEKAPVAGSVATFAMLIMLTTAFFLRRLRYEVFYIVHILMFMLTLITIGLHRPDFAKKAIIITIFTAAIWVADKAFRFLKMSFFSFGNTATITPLAHGATRVTLQRSSTWAVPGSHAFLWIPAIRAIETHPFTIVSSAPLEFVVAAYDGFTHDLHALAQKKPGAVLKATIDGPYGNVPDFTTFNKVLFFAGGIGASFTFGVAVDLIRKLGDSMKTSIEFVWVIRERDRMTWFTKEIEELSNSPLVKLSIYSTENFPNRPASPSSIYTIPVAEKARLPKFEAKPDSSASSQYSKDFDIEKNLPSVTIREVGPIPIKAGRPDVAAIVRGAVDGSKKEDRIAVTGCGPNGMMQPIRRTVADCIRGDAPSVDLFLEQFCW